MPAGAAGTYVPSMSRIVRRLTLFLAGTLTLVLLAVVALVWWGYGAARLDLAGRTTFTNRVAVPPLAESRVDDRGRRVFDLTLQRGETDFGHGRVAETWGINQSYLGPTLRAERGEEVLVNVTNEVGEPSTLHWHGMHLPARMDGGPHQMVDDGETWSPTWQVDQPAATLWYHPHLHGSTADHVYRGLAGMFLVDDPESAGLALPQEYGVDDVPVIVQDKQFDDAGELDDGTSFLNPVGVLGDQVLVNGTDDAYLPVTTELVRLRLLNGSNARIYNLGLDDYREFDLIATDGGLLERPTPMSRLRLSPGERAEVVVAMEPGERVVLRSYPSDVAGDPLQQRWSGGDDTLDVLELRAADDLRASPALPGRLVELPDAEAAAEGAEVDRDFRLATPTINRRAMDMDRIDATVEVGTTEVWRVRNEDGTPHNFHVHDVQFRVVQVDGREPEPALRGRKDTVLVPANTEVVLVMTFEDHTDPDAPYMFHCHLLRHEDQGMMGQFVVVEPGQEAGDPGSLHDH